MATQQQFPLDLNAALVPFWMRAARQRHNDDRELVHAATLRNEQLRAYAHIEAQTWQAIASEERPVLLEVKRREAEESIEKRYRALRDAATAGHALNSEAKTFVDHIALFRENLQEVREGQIGRASCRERV